MDFISILGTVVALWAICFATNSLIYVTIKRNKRKSWIYSVDETFLKVMNVTPYVNILLLAVYLCYGLLLLAEFGCQKMGEWISTKRKKTWKVRSSKENKEENENGLLYQLERVGKIRRADSKTHVLGDAEKAMSLQIEKDLAHATSIFRRHQKEEGFQQLAIRFEEVFANTADAMQESIRIKHVLTKEVLEQVLHITNHLVQKINEEEDKLMKKVGKKLAFEAEFLAIHSSDKREFLE